MDGAKLLTLIQHLDKVRDPINNIGFTVHLYGLSGSGKTTSAYLVARELSKQLGQEVPVVRVVLAASFFEVIRGIPRFTTRQVNESVITVTEDSLPAWFAMGIDRPVVILLDEVDKDTEKFGAVLDVIDHRKLHGVPLHPQTIVMMSSQPWLYGAEQTDNIFTNTQRALISRSVFIKMRTEHVLGEVEKQYGVSLKRIKELAERHIVFDIPRLSEQDALSDVRRMVTTIRLASLVLGTEDEWIYNLMLDQFPANVRASLKSDIEDKTSPISVRKFIKALCEDPLSLWALEIYEAIQLTPKIVGFGTIDLSLMLLARIALDNKLAKEDRAKLIVAFAEAWRDAAEQGIEVYRAEGPNADNRKADERFATVFARICEYAYNRYTNNQGGLDAKQVLKDRDFLNKELALDIPLGQWRCPQRGEETSEAERQSSTQASKKSKKSKSAQS